jgi:hypothetical protein
MTGMAIADARLSPSEDGVLRRLFFFESTGATLAPPLRVLKSELRQRDLRRSVRPPEVEVTRVPHYV